MEQIIYNLKQKYMERYGLTANQANNNIVFCQFNNQLLVGLALCDPTMQDQNFYLYNSETINDLYNNPIAQIKFMTNGAPTMFIRRLEFINNNFKGKGYATKLLQCFENYCAINKFNAITGELIPLHNEPEQKVEAYYTKNGFKIATDQQGQKHIYKNVNTNKITMVGGCAFVGQTKKEDLVL